ncbi:hypothetical protein Ccur_10640 [Cryptobacterium curtum DSM 15641]|uniref:Antitoxin n=1 Tax=Cryptobacterium curtum (strain ATCC 700683 / DSM 15641 / CCUG 43107 / 12-3) TaxID=469378 RepID=C7MPB5_CRYCD|nr:hypothetical protein [Cryptobacterium curtum]ACU94755.1 hypothetical protein Ccur_10640 [Cryptobacterium curtum DSM 15641]
MGTVMVSIRIPSDLNDRYMQLVKETGRLRSFYINEVLAESIDRLEYEYGVLRQIKACRAGRLETYSLDEMRAHCGLEN